MTVWVLLFIFIALLNRASLARTRSSHARSMSTGAPDGTRLRTVGSPCIRPITVTGLAGRISSPLLMGVGPKNMQKALPGGQYPRSPSSTTSCPISSPAATGMAKYISSPQVLADASMGRASQISGCGIGDVQGGAHRHRAGRDLDCTFTHEHGPPVAGLVGAV